MRSAFDLDFERLLGGKHPDARVLESKRHNRIVARGIDDDRGSSPLNATSGLDVARQLHHRPFKNRAIRNRHNAEITHQLKRPSGIVVRRRVLRRVVLR